LSLVHDAVAFVERVIVVLDIEDGNGKLFVADNPGPADSPDTHRGDAATATPYEIGARLEGKEVLCRQRYCHESSRVNLVVSIS
jgi:hypothetical protein